MNGLAPAGKENGLLNSFEISCRFAAVNAIVCYKDARTEFQKSMVYCEKVW